MDRFIRIAAYIANIVLLISVSFIMAHSYGQDVYYALLLALPPVLSIISLYLGPDLEERRLTRKLTKAKLRQELTKLEKQEKTKKQDS